MQVAGRELGEPDLIQAVRLEGGVYRVRFGRRYDDAVWRWSDDHWPAHAHAGARSEAKPTFPW